MASARERLHKLLAPGEAVRADAWPLSYPQERIWFLERMEPANPAYNVPSALRLRGALDCNALEHAVEEVPRRHAALRTRFVLVGSAPAQVVDDEVELKLQVRIADQATLERTVEDIVLEGFDLTEPPLARAVLLRVAADDHVLVLVAHHAVADAWSLRVLERDLGELYGAAAAGHDPDLPPLRLRYVDFAVWQRKVWDSTAAEAEADYWRRQLIGAPQVLDLAPELPRAEARAAEGRLIRFELPAATEERLRALAAAEGATPAMALLAGFGALLHRLARRDDILVGVPVAGREQSELEPLAGVFLNMLALRLDASGRPSFRDYLRRVRTTALDAYEHQQLPFERVLAELRPPREAFRAPLVQVLFNFVSLPGPPPTFPALELEAYPVPVTTSAFDATLYAFDEADRLRLEFLFRADLFHGARAAEIVEQLSQLVDRATNEPAQPLLRHSLVATTGRRMLPDPRERLPGGSPDSVHARVAAAAAREPTRPAVLDRNGSWTYRDLIETSERLAALLHNAGLREGEVVAIAAERNAALVVALLAALRSGGLFAVLDPAYPPAALAERVALVAPTARLDVGSPPTELVQSSAEWRTCFTVPATPSEAERALAAAPAPTAARDRRPDEPAYVAFTSGSTGKAKAVVGRHGPLTAFVDWLAATFDLDAADRFSMLSGLGHDPLHRDVFLPLALGATICCPGPEDIAPRRLRAWLAEQGVTVAGLTPAMIRLLVTGAEETETLALRRVFSVGEPLPVELANRLRSLAPDALVVNVYGTTETQQALSYHVLDPTAEPAGTVPIGRGFPGVQLLLLNNERERAGVGEPAEIHFRSRHIAAGYTGASQTAASFVPSPFGGGERLYRTGDIGRYRADGEVELVGRADRQLQVRGFRVEPAEVEAALCAHPLLQAAVVHPAPDDGRLAAYVVATGDVAAADVLARARERLAPHMVPSFVVPLPRLPLGPNGKVDVDALPHPQPCEEPQRPGLDPVASRIAQVWSDVLGVGAVGASENFFDVGGDSLSLAAVQVELERAFGRDVSIVELLRRPTVAALADLLRA